MSIAFARRLQCAAACAAIAVYASLSHYCNSVAGAHVLGTALAVTPIAAIGVVSAWQTTSRPLAIFLIAALACLLYAWWPSLQRNFQVLSLLEEGGIYCGLGLTFGRSLLPDRVPICTRLADKVHGPLSPREEVYTRRVTAAWAVFFFAETLTSLLLFLLAPLKIWSFYINFCALPLVGMMFLAEYWVRRRVLPENHRSGLLATVRVYFATPQ